MPTAYERAVLLTPTLENVRCWVECTRMRPEEIEDSVQESYELIPPGELFGEYLPNFFAYGNRRSLRRQRWSYSFPEKESAIPPAAWGCRLCGKSTSRMRNRITGTKLRPCSAKPMKELFF